ncbi:isoprenylcysteine O-methyltransferase [Seminavis robusta]|uniref:Protein-S-isoprenylcysteine O-methyltransferase n=1 Tax=Seminavis robusta TaxID=568900 RepID=A0A9N8HVJ3_9STRA|nr:isoprenylcysteine O-methyltransferase [Seminavis robusta]|eukprot:Sro1993_g309940.1 isoprenylcysteine O-methyltransferase (276) ;mRNA; r:14600-15620
MKETAFRALQGIQSKLSFEGWPVDSQFRSVRSLGRTATIAVLLGVILGTHICLFSVLILHRRFTLVPVLDDFFSPERIDMLWQWSGYIVLVCCFHLTEFFITAIYNPTVVTADSFLVNHSLGYTAAFLASATEFWARFCLCPSMRAPIFMVGLAMVIFGQVTRAVAMATCGASFNHLIQTSKKDNHVLVTHGIYSYLRHPSYVGFYYWAIGAQILLNNILHSILFAVATTIFFRRRIPYEEESLMHYFPDQYACYAASTWVGIPFVPQFKRNKIE